ncbi:MAG: NAD(P)-binding domain-containing protein [Planctomycetes bacterium]|nr:NAD(P)-binding domain-containing protein [Planctomycetota bacterium]
MGGIERISVIGAGTMGSGIAQVCAAAGKQVTLIDTGPAQLEAARVKVQDSLRRMVKKGALTQADAEAALTRIRPAPELAAAKDAQLVIEAIFEKESIKLDTWHALESLCPPGVLFASNTSSISITKLASATQRPELFIGMHFFNPVPVMKLVEVIRGNKTSAETNRIVVELSRELGKSPVEVNDYPGFVSNRVLMPLINEAIFAVFEGVATPEAVDEVFKLGMAHPMGPLTLADFIGLDVCLDIMNVLHEGFGDPKYRPCPLLKQMVAAGKLGRKTKHGFYAYND